MPEAKHKPAPPPIAPSILQSTIAILPISIPPLGGRPPHKQSRYKLLVCKDPILPLPPPKPPDMHIDTITTAYHPPKIEDVQVDEDAIEPDFKTDFEENAPQ